MRQAQDVCFKMYQQIRLGLAVGMFDWEASQSKTRITITVNLIIKEGRKEGLKHLLQEISSQYP
jgi:hypothetical protein